MIELFLVNISNVLVISTCCTATASLSPSQTKEEVAEVEERQRPDGGEYLRGDVRELDKVDQFAGVEKYYCGQHLPCSSGQILSPVHHIYLLPALGKTETDRK